MERKAQKIFFLAGCLSICACANAQLTISGQLRTRSELRDGQGAPSVKDTAPAFFTSQRSRLNVGFAAYRLHVYASAQDARVWGQDASSINRNTPDANDGFMLHESWAEISLVDTGRVVKNFTLKVGRQELVYDDARLLGNLDWLQQGRRHDAALIKLAHAGWTAHLGAAFNQNAERKSGTIYNGVPTGYTAGTNGMTSLYKSMQFLHVSRKLSFGTLSLLSLKDDFSRFHFAPADTGRQFPVYGPRSWSRITTGLNAFGAVMKNVSVAASAFYQGGRYRDGTPLNEYLLSLSAMYATGKKFSAGPGIDVTSGNNGSDPSRKYKRFDPLYGTPHKFWGFMDYFYAADGYGANGLVDIFLKNKLRLREHFTLTLDGHRFSLPKAVTDESGATLEKMLGHELDLVFNCNIAKAVSFEGGYCAFFSSPTLTSSKVKNVKNPDATGHWAYIMITVGPELLIRN